METIIGLATLAFFLYLAYAVVCFFVDLFRS